MSWTKGKNEEHFVTRSFCGFSQSILSPRSTHPCDKRVRFRALCDTDVRHKLWNGAPIWFMTPESTLKKSNAAPRMNITQTHLLPFLAFQSHLLFIIQSFNQALWWLQCLMRGRNQYGPKPSWVDGGQLRAVTVNDGLSLKSPTFWKN